MFRLHTGFSAPKYDDPEESQDVPQENSVLSDRIPGTCQTGEKLEIFDFQGSVPKVTKWHETSKHLPKRTI